MAGVATGQAVRFQVFADPELVTGVFDAIEIWRSRDGEAGPFEEITASIWTTAVHLIADRPFSVSGKSLLLRVNELNDLTIAFTGVDPVSSSSIASQIQTQGLGLLRTSIAGGFISMETAQPGAVVTLRVVESDAAAILGLPIAEPDSVAFGHDARIAIIEGQAGYNVIDPHGSSDYFYKVRFRNKDTNAVSDFSDAFSGNTTGGVDPSELVRGTLKLVDMLGNSLPNYNVLLHNTFKGTSVGDSLVVGGPVQALTDSNGQVEFFLVRGITITVAVAGTNIVRDVTVPEDPEIESFNLLDPSLGPDDLFKVQVPNIPFAERRSL